MRWPFPSSSLHLTPGHRHHMNNQGAQGQSWPELIPTHPSAAQEKHLCSLLVSHRDCGPKSCPCRVFVCLLSEVQSRSEALVNALLLVHWAGFWGLPGPRRDCVWVWGGQQDLAGLSTAPSAHLGPGELPRVLQGHRAQSPHALPLLRPVLHFPGGRVGSERSDAYACSTGESPHNSDVAAMKVGCSARDGSPFLCSPDSICQRDPREHYVKPEQAFSPTQQWRGSGCGLGGGEFNLGEAPAVRNSLGPGLA